ncbi:hypothetical protein JVT61DRAFT_6443 [Boletus reticuloceps]|uniref:Mediator of RNA polymerase II transcription subunit 25 von Willebrand factor type A domain-containing protein n=1 Tax=Boletus reticuloceps TaxID=495285 RepID=A0A8I2YJZ8_9AGAM|nr:hypothetical protein JVT61DRAFT_6443 [Boletus reticuloceps]
MSAGPEPSADLVAVACVVDASLLLASEWSRVLIEYVYPLLKRLHELYPSHQFSLAFVTYASADTRPLPLLSRRYFAPLSQITKELREEPSKLGIGQSNSGSGKGLSALEGLVAAIELFDTLNHMQSPQKDNRSLISHILHIAASPPDAAQRPHCNILQHLDFVNWDSIPSELRKRKINLSLICLRKIPQFQDLQSSVAGPGVQSPWFNVHTPHVLLLAGFPTPQKTSTKRQTEPQPSDQSPDAKRQKVAADPIPKPSSASPALTPARIPQNQRLQQPVSQITQPPSTTSGQNSSPTQPLQAPTSVPVSTPANASPSAPLPLSAPSVSSMNNDILDQVVAPTGLKFRQMIERLPMLEREIAALDARIASARDTGQTAVLAGLQEDRTTRSRIKEQIKTLLKQHYHRVLLAKDSLDAQVGATGPALPNPSTEPGPPTQSHPPNAPSASSERPTGSTMEEHKPMVSDSQAVAQFWQARGGTISAPSGSNPQAGPSQMPSHPTVTPEVAAQMQKLIEMKGIRPPSFGPSSQTYGTTSHETGVSPNVTNNQVIQSSNSTWIGMFSGTFPRLSGQGTNEVQIHVVGAFTTPKPTDVRAEIRTDIWPKNLTLKPCKEPVRDNTELTSWIRRHQSRTRIMQFIPNPRAPNASINEQRFQALYNFMSEHRIYAYAGWQLPSGKFSYNIFIFATHKGFVGAVFPDGLPDLPGSGNTLDVQPSVQEAKPPSGITIPPALLARMQGLDPATQRQLLAHCLQLQQQERLRRQQLQTQQPHTASGQALGSLGMSIPPNPYSVPNIPAGLHTNVNAPTNAGAYNARGGTVNYEMLQSFMQRNAEGSTSQGK